MKYRPEIDGLRALAVVPVILFHAGFDTFSGGYIGVDIFFVISGYLITTLIVTDLTAGNFSLMSFYERRARRILPVLSLVLLCSVPPALFLMSPDQLLSYSHSLMAVSVFVSNVLFWLESGYFAPAAEEMPLLHTWSLAVEEQFYVIFPVLLIFAWRFGARSVTWLLLILGVASFVLSDILSGVAPSASFFLITTRAWELLTGALVALYLRQASPGGSDIKALLGLAAIAFAVFAYDASTPYPGRYAVVPVIGVVLVILFARPGMRVTRLLAAKPIVGIGLISYSAYLWHQPLFAFARIHYLETPGTLLMLTLAVTAFALAGLSWRLIEQPFRDRRNFSRRFITLFSVLAMLLPFAIGFLGHTTRGFYADLLDPEQRALMASVAFSPRREACHTSGAGYRNYADACEYKHGEVKVAVMGDSHAIELAWALAQELEPHGVALKHLSFSGCVPAYKADFTGFETCAAWTDDMTNALLVDKRITTVVLSYRMMLALQGEHRKTYPELPSAVDGPQRNAIWRSFETMMADLRRAGKTVVYVVQAPELPEPMTRIIRKTPDAATRPFLPGVPHAWWRDRTAFLTEKIALLPADVVVIDPATTFCRDDICHAARDGVALYADDNHLSIQGAKFPARQIAASILDGSD